MTWTYIKLLHNRAKRHTFDFFKKKVVFGVSIVILALVILWSIPGVPHSKTDILKAGITVTLYLIFSLFVYGYQFVSATGHLHSESEATTKELRAQLAEKMSEADFKGLLASLLDSGQLLLRDVHVTTAGVGLTAWYQRLDGWKDEVQSVLRESGLPVHAVNFRYAAEKVKPTTTVINDRYYLEMAELKIEAHIEKLEEIALTAQAPGNRSSNALRGNQSPV
jgi:hypothetical protein